MQRVKTHQEPLRSELSNDVESEGGSYAESENLRWDERIIRALDARNEGGIRVDVPEFHGRLNPEEFLDWLNSLEKLFDWKDMPDQKRVKFAATRLKGHAAIWWDQIQADRRLKGKEPIGTWEKMKSRLRGKFVPPPRRSSLQNLRQRERSVQEYTEEFHQLSIRNALNEPLLRVKVLKRWLGM